MVIKGTFLQSNIEVSPVISDKKIFRAYYKDMKGKRDPEATTRSPEWKHHCRYADVTYNIFPILSNIETYDKAMA